jgi:hypothetical protein
MLAIPADIEQLARLVALKSGQAPEQVVRDAVEERARAFGIVGDRPARPVDMAKIDAITRRSASRPLRDQRGAAEILDDAWGDPA